MSRAEHDNGASQLDGPFKETKADFFSLRDTPSQDSGGIWRKKKDQCSLCSGGPELGQS